MINIWIVVHTEKGFIQEPEIFQSYKDALYRKSYLLKYINPDYDEVDLFERIISIAVK